MIIKEPTGYELNILCFKLNVKLIKLSHKISWKYVRMNLVSTYCDVVEYFCKGGMEMMLDSIP